ncbi:hypothetical protein MLD38_024402 [Melastoma candidum]|uniref:Uncharacterized protein n=1 Tax=Melastoma candidum TaxID=119954 RepID=A0ACB9NVK5_9MYRT|nr:hypothetical protein MLD38_024402 [Melastoma candidum]
MKRDHGDTSKGSSSSSTSSSTTSAAGSACSNLWDTKDPSPSAGMDELLAVLGYKVRSSDMADVALKLELLEMAMYNNSGATDISFATLPHGTSLDDDAGLSYLSHLSSDAVHYNPSDLSSWLQSMLSELNPTPDFSAASSSQQQPPPPPPAQPPLRQPFPDYSACDLSVIPGAAATPPNKRLKASMNTAAASPPTASSSSALTAVSPPRPVVLVDSQETGVRLVHTLMACAEAVQQENLKLADALVKHVSLLAASQPGAMRKVATYFAEALARRIYRIYPREFSLNSSSYNILQMHFYESCPYLKFAHFTANQAILEAFATVPRVHVIDFGLKEGMQWPALMQALALRPGGPPAFRLTGIGPPQPDNTDTLQQVGWKLAQLADTIGVEFDFRGFVANSLADLEPSMLNISSSEVETVAVNSVFELHKLLAMPGAIEKVLGSIRAMRPKIFTMVEQEANHNSPVFLDRFNEALHYYSSLFDSLAGCGAGASEDTVMSEVYLGRQICNIVACEGTERVERHESLIHWRSRMESAGFNPVHLGSNAFKQASMLLALFAGEDGYRVEENNGSLMLGWHTRPLIATSAWQLGSSNGGP